MFTKWMKTRKHRGPAEAMVVSKRFAFDLTPREVAAAVIMNGHRMVDKDGVSLDDMVVGSYDDDTGRWVPRRTPEETRAFVAKNATQKQVNDDLKDTLFEYGLGESTTLMLLESRNVSEEHYTAVAEGLVDAFVDEDTLARLFGEDAA